MSRSTYRIAATLDDGGQIQVVSGIRGDGVTPATKFLTPQTAGPKKRVTMKDLIRDYPEAVKGVPRRKAAIEKAVRDWQDEHEATQRGGNGRDGRRDGHRTFAW